MLSSACYLSCEAQQPPSSGSPFNLLNLLPAGTYSLPLIPRESTSCNHRNTEDGWHNFQESIIHHLFAPDDSLLRELSFLVHHSYISVASHIKPSGDMLVLRIYIIPHDLPNVQGQLRVRDETKSLGPARRYLRMLLPRLVQGPELWEGSEAPLSSPPRSLIPPVIVSDKIIL